MTARFDLITLFPEMFEPLRRHGVAARAHAQGAWSATAWNPRDFTEDAHRTVDDRPFGGGPGMVLLAEPLARSVAAAREAQRGDGRTRTHVLSFAAAAKPLVDARVRELAAALQEGVGLVLVCGRYEGIDQRFLDECVDEEVSLGDYVLSGGEIAAMALVDAIVRLLPGTIRAESAQEESFASGLLDAPHFTRPELWRGRGVPPVLLSGHHENIRRWRLEEARARTQQLRPDLMQNTRFAATPPSSGAEPGKDPAGSDETFPLPTMAPGVRS